MGPTLFPLYWAYLALLDPTPSPRAGQVKAYLDPWPSHLTKLTTFPLS